MVSMLRSLSLAGVLVGALAVAGPAHASVLSVTQADPSGDASPTSAGTRPIDVTSVTVGLDAATGTLSARFTGSFVHQYHSANRFTVALGQSLRADGSCAVLAQPGDVVLRGQSYGDSTGGTGTYVELDDAQGFVTSGTGTAAAGAVAFAVASPTLAGRTFRCAADVSATYGDYDLSSTDDVRAFALTAAPAA